MLILRYLFFTIGFVLFLLVPAQAEPGDADLGWGWAPGTNALDSTAATGDQGQLHDNGKSLINYRPDAPNFGQVEDPYASRPAAPSAAQGQSQRTNSQGYRSPHGPELDRAVSSRPYRGSYLAPGNLALNQLGLFFLPPTRTDSFVKKSGYNFSIYGDEGEDGPPPLNFFTEEKRIERGIHSRGLTTGHRGRLPSAWDFPN